MENKKGEFVRIDFADWLQEQIDERGITPTELARRSGVQPGSITRVLNRQRVAGADLCRAIAGGLRLTPEYVFRRAGLLPDTSPAQPNDPILEELLIIAQQLTPAEQRRLTDVADLFLKGQARYGDDPTDEGDAGK